MQKPYTTIQTLMQTTIQTPLKTPYRHLYRYLGTYTGTYTGTEPYTDTYRRSNTLCVLHTCAFPFIWQTYRISNILLRPINTHTHRQSNTHTHTQNTHSRFRFVSIWFQVHSESINRNYSLFYVGLRLFSVSSTCTIPSLPPPSLPSIPNIPTS